jgi:hypothetical protein
MGWSLAVGDDPQPVSPDPQRLEVVHGALGPLLAQGEVVFFGSALIAVALDEDLDRAPFPEPAGVRVEHGLGVLANEVLVVVEIDRSERLLAVGACSRDFCMKSSSSVRAGLTGGGLTFSTLGLFLHQVAGNFLGFRYRR